MSQVWLATLRRGIAYHAVAPGGRTTDCGRFVGDPAGEYPRNGHLLPLDEALELGARECRTCVGFAEHQKPRVAPSRDRTVSRG